MLFRMGDMSKSKSMSSGSKRANGNSGTLTVQQDSSREKIIAAARKVFAEHPYYMATIRMVGNAGGFDHQLIAYYFPTKAELFEAVVAATCEEFYLANKSWYIGIEGLGLREGFSLYLDRLLEYNTLNPEPLRIMALNAPLIERLDEIPGYFYIPEVLAKTRTTFEDNIKLVAGPDEIGRFINTFNTFIIFYLGAAPSQAEVLGMNPQSLTYRNWVKETFLYVFSPLLKNLVIASETTGLS